MAPKAAEDKLDFLLKVFATCDEFKPNYGKLKDVMGINTNANAQRQFKSIVEADKLYTLESGGGQTRVVDNSKGSAQSGVAPAKPRKRNKKESEDGDEEEVPVKKARKSKTKKDITESGGGQTRVVDNSKGSAQSGVAPAKPRKRNKKESEDGDEEEVPVKKARKSKTKKDVTESDGEEDDEE